MKIDKYKVQQRQKRWNSNKHNKLLEIRPTLGEWKQSYRKNWKEVISFRLCIGHTKTTHSYLLEAKRQPTCHVCQTKYTVKNILIECNNLAHLRETFYSANDMKELFQKNWNEKCNVIPKSGKFIWKNLKEFSTRPNFSYKLFLYKKYFNKIWSSPLSVY